MVDTPTSPTAELTAFCPHCLIILPDVALPGPRAAMRCPHCRLLVAAGRAIDGDRARSATAASSPASLSGNAARRSEVEAGDPAEVGAAIHAAARAVGRSVSHLRMLEYQEYANGRDGFPSLEVVLSTFGSWRRARVAADEREPDPEGARAA